MRIDRSRKWKLRRKVLGSLVVVVSVAALFGLPAPAGAAPSLYIANAGTNAVSQFGLDVAGFPSLFSPPAVAALEGPEQIALSPDGASAYVTAQIDDKVAQYDIDPITIGKGPAYGAFFVSSGRCDEA